MSSTSSIVSKLKPLLVPARVKHSATIIFLHGSGPTLWNWSLEEIRYVMSLENLKSALTFKTRLPRVAFSGDTGLGVKTWLQLVNHNEDLNFPHIRIIYPTAPERPYTPMLGQMSTVWFDRKQITPYAPEDASLDEASDLIDDLINLEVKNGIPRQRIILGGFSMGGALAMYYGLHRASDLCALFGLSSFLNESSKVYETLRRNPPAHIPPVFQCHGDKDPLVHPDWGSATSHKLRGLGVNCTFHMIPDMFHEMRPSELSMFKEWIVQQLPEE